VRSFGGGKGLDDVVVGRKEKEREVLRPTDSSQRTANGKLTGEVLHRRFANRARGIRKEHSVEWQHEMGEWGKGEWVGGLPSSLDRVACIGCRLAR
jgi:hypothetical protein